VNGAKTERSDESMPEGAVSVYCLGTLVAEEAQRTGCNGFAQALEKVLSGFLETLPRDVQSQALRLSYEMALGGENPAVPKLRLVYSRD
jgi:hypothetical protein